MKKRKCSELIVDFDLYPRGQRDSQHISDIVSALAAGEEMPPVIICKKSKRIVDGVHRHAAYLRHFGDDAEIEVIEKTYASDREFFIDAMRYNSGHGAKLRPFDCSHCAIIAERLHIAETDLASALRMTTDRLSALRVGRTASNEAAQSVPIKASIRHKAGDTLTPQQEQVNKKLSGMNTLFHVNQIIMLIDSDLLDTDNPDLMHRLTVLQEKLAGMLVAA